MIEFILWIVFGFFFLKGLSMMLTGGVSLAKKNPELCAASAKRIVRFLSK